MTAGGDRPRLGWPAAFVLPALLIGSAMAQDEAQQPTPIVPSEQVRRLEGKEILGVSAESISRCMADLKRQGLIRRVAPWTYQCAPELVGVAGWRPPESDSECRTWQVK